jgi:hypothetical protein
MAGSSGAQIPGSTGTVTVTGAAGGIAAAVPGTAAAVTVSAPAGFVVLVPYRYVRWRIRRGFAPAGPRSHVIAGNPGMITVTAPAGTAGTA